MMDEASGSPHRLVISTRKTPRRTHFVFHADTTQYFYITRRLQLGSCDNICTIHKSKNRIGEVKIVV